MTSIEQMPDSEYFTLDAIDQSALKRFMVSPLAYVDYLDHGLDVSKASLDFGSAAHGLVLGSGVKIAVKPNMRTKEGKERFKELAGSGTWLLSESDVLMANEMAARSSSYFKAIPGRPEVAILADDPDTGLSLKGKVDWLPDGPDDDGVLRIRDYKTTRDDPRDFERTAARMGYHIQAAFYMRLYRLTGYTGPLGFEFVVQEKTRPYDFAVWRFSEDCDEIAVADARIGRALDELHGFMADSPDDWKQRMAGYGLDKTPRDIEFTGWQMDKEDEEAGL
mgnify:CR=1 FL=1